MKLSVDPAALEELLEAEEYTSQEFGKTVVREFRLNVASTLEEITQFPEHYSKTSDNIRAKTLQPYPYSIIYEEINDTVRVYAFAHNKRKPGYWRKWI